MYINKKEILNLFHYRAVTIGVLFLLLLSTQKSFANESSNYALEASDLINRVFGGSYSNNVDFEVLVSSSGLDRFEVSTSNGRLKIKGNNAVSMVSGFNWYLKNKLNQHVSRNGTNLDGGFHLVPLDSAVSIESPYKYRYAQNYTFFGYQSPYWGWDEWQRELDILALEGFNMLLSPVGVEAVLKQTFMDEGLSEADFHQWLNAPAHIPWQLMSNTHSQGGQVYGQNSTWFNRQIDLQKKILNRQSALGITSVVPGFYGVIPKELSANYSGARVYHQGNWVGLPSVSLLNAEEPDFQRIAKNYYSNYSNTFGFLPKYISADPFHEGSPPAGWDISELGKAIQHSMIEANPDAIWVFQHWLHTPHAEIFHAIDRSKALVASLFNDSANQWLPRNEFEGTPWLRGTIENFGGNSGYSGKLESLSHALPGDMANSQYMVGMGSFPEGTHYNPMYYSLQADMIWQREKMNLDSWIAQYQQRRYGFSNTNTQLAAEILRRDILSPKNTQGAYESILTARPADEIRSASTWGPAVRIYRPSQVKKALGLMLSESGSSNSSAFRFDLVDLTRQMMADTARVIHEQMVAAADAGDLDKFNALSSQFLVLMDDQDRLLGSRSEFMFGTWLKHARAAGGNEAESDAYEKNFRLLVTAWEDSEALKDYSNREWSGLIGTFYKERWQKWIDYKKSVIQGQTPQAINWHQFELHWSDTVAPFATQPVGDSVSLAREMYSKYAKLIDHSDSQKGELIVTLKNRYSGKYLVDTGSGAQVRTDVSPGHFSSQWHVNQIDGTNRYRFVNRFTGKALHIENFTGALESGDVPETWWSSQWLLSVGNTNEPETSGLPVTFARVSNYWQQHIELNNEDQSSTVAATDVPDTYWSADWKLTQVADFTGQTRISTKNSYESIVDEQSHSGDAQLEQYAKSIGYWSADWDLVHIQDGYYRVTNRYTKRVIHVETTNGYANLTSSVEVPNTWWSAQWLIEQTEDGYYRLRNRFMTDYYIHTANQDGVPQTDKRVESYDIAPSNTHAHFVLQSESDKY